MIALGSTNHTFVENSSLHFVRKMNGSAQSLLMRDIEGKLWVVKPKSLLQGPNALANEFVGSELCRALGLPIPDSKTMCMNESSQDLRSWLHSSSGKLPVEPGLHFASRYLPDATGTDVYEIIPPTLRSAVQDQSECLGMFIFDVWAIHTDRRQALFCLRGSKLVPTFFDNSHLFGGPHWQSANPQIYPFMLQRVAMHWQQETGEADGWITRMQSLIPAALERAIGQIPACWFEGNLQVLMTRLLYRLDELHTLVETAFAELEDQCNGVHGVETIFPGCDFRMLSQGGTERWS